MTVAELRELRLTYTLDGMAKVMAYIDGMKLGELPDYMALFLVHCSNTDNWQAVEDREA